MLRGSASAQSYRYSLHLFRCCPSIGESSTISSFSGKQHLRSPACWSLLDLGDAYLLQQRQIVLDVPIVGDAAVLDLDEVSGDEGTGCLPALPEPPVKWPVKFICTVT